MKPLELTVYETDEETGRYMCADGVTYAAEAVNEFADWKRLTEAELCAEFEAARCDAMIQSATGACWQPLGYTWPMDSESIHERAQTLLRFASSPHYREESA